MLIYPVRNNAPLLSPGQAPPRRAGFIPFRDKSLTGFNAPLGRFRLVPSFESQRLEFLTGLTCHVSFATFSDPSDKLP